MMKVLILDSCYKNGSTGKIVYDLFTYLKSSGIEATVCYGRGKKVNETGVFKFSIGIETAVHALLTRITGYTGCFSFFSTRRLIRYIQKFKPDVVNLHELHAYFLNVTQLLKFLKKNNIKVVHTLHCSFSFTGKCGSHLNCEKWKTECGNCPRLRDYVSTAFFDHTKTMYLKKKEAFSNFNDMTIVCPSEWLASYAKQSFLGSYPVKVIHNGVDTSIFYPRDNDELRKRLNIENDKKIVLSVAPHLMSDLKGGKWILDLAKRTMNNNLIFIMIGVDDTSIAHTSNVMLFNSIKDQNELAAYYSLSDVFLLCSSSETFSMTCAESISCGTPVVGFKCGAPETIFPNTCATFVNYGDLTSLEDALMKTVNSPKIIDNKLFSTDKMCKRYLDTFRNEGEFQ